MDKTSPSAGRKYAFPHVLSSGPLVSGGKPTESRISHHLEQIPRRLPVDPGGLHDVFSAWKNPRALADARRPGKCHQVQGNPEARSRVSQEKETPSMEVEATGASRDGDRRGIEPWIADACNTQRGAFRLSGSWKKYQYIWEQSEMLKHDLALYAFINKKFKTKRNTVSCPDWQVRFPGGALLTGKELRYDRTSFDRISGLGDDRPFLLGTVAREAKTSVRKT